MSTTRTWFAQAHAVMFVGVLLVAGIARAALPAQAAVASAHPLATGAGQEILERGGNAFDAAIAVAATLAVVEPYGAGLGGGAFFLLRDARTGQDLFVDAREMAPQVAVANMYENARGEVVRDWSVNGPLAAAIPGTPAALVHIAAKYGQLPLATSLAPAIRYARDGFPVDERYRQVARSRLEEVRRFVDTSRIFLLKGEVPPLGTRVRQPELAALLEAIAQSGHDGFYRGEVAIRLVDEVSAAGGVWTVEDLAKYQVVERAALAASFRGARIVTAPPPSAGGVALLSALQMLEASGFPPANAAARDHLIVEVLRRAARDGALSLGDPDFVSVPVQQLLSAEHVGRQIAGIQLQRATSSASLGNAVAPSPQGESASHLSIIDRHGNAVSATLSINATFGSAFTVPGTGLLLNNAMADFSAAPGVPDGSGLFGSGQNAIAPYKRPLSSMTPTLVEYNDRVAILGTPGGNRAPAILLAALLSLLEAKTPLEAISGMRFSHGYMPDQVEVEPEYFGSAAARELRARGHVIRSTGRAFGNAQVIVWEKAEGRVTAASDPRGSGQATIR